MSGVFTKIIKGEIPSYKVYEDDKTFAFLDIHPETRGHVLVVPKVEVGKIYELSDEDYAALWGTVRKLAEHMDKVLGERIIIKVVGVDLPEHAHVHLMPFDPDFVQGQTLELDDAEMREIAEKLRL